MLLLKVFSIILLHVYIYRLHYRGFKKFALRYYNYSSTTSSRRVGSRHMRVVCRLRQLRRIAYRVLWRSGCILPWRHPFIRHIKTLSSKMHIILANAVFHRIIVQSCLKSPISILQKIFLLILRLCIRQ